MTMAQVMILFYISSNRLKDQHGLTLLEMLVVVFILSAIALMTLSFTNNADDQFRFEDTRTRLEKIRTAIAGEPDRTINGGPAVSGFVVDIGRLPNNNALWELLQPHSDPTISCGGVGALPCWSFDSAVGLWAGWRGPYLTPLIEQGGTRTYRDGWGNPGVISNNYGWKTFSATDTNADTLNDKLEVASFGSDGDSVAPEDSYARDYPDASSDLSADDLVVQDAHQINLKGWQVTVNFFNPPSGAASLPAVATTLRIRLYYPQNGSFNYPISWPPPTPDNQPYLSMTQTLAAGEVLDNTSVSKTFSFGATDKFVPWGIRALALINDSDGTIFVSAMNKTKIVTLAPRTQLAPITDMEWRLE